MLKMAARPDLPEEFQLLGEYNRAVSCGNDGNIKNAKLALANYRFKNRAPNHDAALLADYSAVVDCILGEHAGRVSDNRCEVVTRQTVAHYIDAAGYDAVNAWRDDDIICRVTWKDI